MSLDPSLAWEGRFRRERTAREEAEALLESKSLELYEANRKLEEGRLHLERRVDTGARPVRFEGSRVLVAEDNPVNQVLARAILERLGCEVAFADHGREAVHLATAESWDLILMDWQMPELNGLDATREIRSREGGRVVPIVAMTENAMVGDREECIAAGMHDYLTKPIRAEQLVECLTRWLPGGAVRSA